MDIDFTMKSNDEVNMYRSLTFIRPPKYIAGFLLSGIIALLLVACGGGTSGTQATASPTVVQVNGFGTAANHVHSLLALPPNVLVMATHYGLFRSQNGGTSWEKVAGGSNQLMEGLMTYSLTYSSLNPQRLYVLTQPAVLPHTGTVGLYTSADQGKTWKLSIASASITSRTIFVVAPGNDTPDEVYVYLSELGPLGLKRSLDNGQHFTSTGTLPFGMIFGVLAIPGAPGHLLAYSSDGMAYSTDGGIHWEVIKNISSSVNDGTTAGPHSPIYASGDAGIYSSSDGGKTFKLVYTQASFASLTASPAQPQVIYGKTGTSVYRSDDGGHSWNTLPHISGNLAVLSADPMNASSVYLSLSYPTALYRFSQDSNNWLSLTPQT
jgi:photosystem II stability/assembly factor-like uncharacterized protein